MGKRVRRLIAVSLGLVLCLLGGQVQATIQWQTPTVPVVQDWLVNVATDPVNPQTLYVSTNSGHVFKSIDGGVNWAAADAGLADASGNPVITESLVIDPNNPQVLYTGTRSGGVFKSLDGGSSWSAINNGLLLPTVGLPFISVLAIDPINPQALYVGTNTDGIFKSSNGGANWAAINTGLADSFGNLSGINTLTVDSFNPQIVYAGTGGNGVYKSVDGGLNWTPVNTGLPNGYAWVSSLAVDSGNPKILYTVVENNGIYKTVDGGASWTLVGTQATGLPVDGYGQVSISTLLMDPANSQVVYVGTVGNGVYKSSDGGVSWVVANTGQDNLYNGAGVSVGALAVAATDPANPQASHSLYAATFSSGLFKSADAGGSWQAVGASTLVKQQVSVFLVSAVDPQAANTWYISVFQGSGSVVFKTTDGGVSWQAASTGLVSQFGSQLSFINALVMDPVQPQTLYIAAWSDGVFKSTDGGASWVLINTDLVDSSGNISIISTLAMDPVNPQTLYAGTIGNGIFKSSDGGTSWTAVNTGLTDTLGNLPYIDIYKLAVNPVNTQIVYAGTQSNGIYKSSDGGASWVLANTGLPVDVSGNIPNIRSLAVSPLDSQVVYAGTHIGVFKSSDGGTHWVATGQISISTVDANTGRVTITIPSDFSDLIFHPLDSNTLYVGTTIGVFKTTDGGTHWVAETTGLVGPFAGFVNVNALVIDLANPSILYAATDSGIQRGIETVPQGQVRITGGQIQSNTAQIALDLTCVDDVACTTVELSNDQQTWTLVMVNWTNTATVGFNAHATVAWDMGVGDGLHTVYARFGDGTHTSPTVSTDITLDTTPPVITPPADVTVEATGTDTTVSLTPPAATDLFAVTQSNDAPTSFPVGTTSVTWTATDRAGNTATATQNVIVTDTIAPVIAAPANITVEATTTSGASVTDSTITAFLTAATTSDAVDGTGIAVNDAPATLPLGATTVTFTATDAAGNVATPVTATITVQDTIAPIIVTPTAMTVEATAASTSITLTAPTVTDLFAVIMTNDAPASYSLGTTTVNWVARDANGNSAVVQQQVTVQDTTAPIITLTGAGSITLTQGESFTGSGATAGDAVDGTIAVTVNGTVDTNTIGSYTLTFTATDAAGNMATAVTRTVKVVATPPSSGGGALNLWVLLLLGSLVIKARVSRRKLLT